MLKRKVLFAVLFSLLIFSDCNKRDIINGLPSINSDNNKVVGASAHDLLASSNFTSLKIEIQYMPGYAADATALNNLISFLNTLINKPSGITVSQQQVSASGKTTLTLNDIGTIEQQNRTAFNSGSQITVYLLVADAAYTDANVLGVAFRNTSVCLFGKTIHNNSGAIGQVSRNKLETTVLEHEFGHLLGLVDLGSNMQTAHKDASHGNHCNNNNCLMYYASETTDLLGFLLTGNVPTLDANCISDLHANGGK
jgi:hypothetical protein